jgi:hypothetical protein
MIKLPALSVSTKCFALLATQALERQSQAMDQRVSFFRLDHWRDGGASRPLAVARPLALAHA